ncbi:MAG TPA: tetratricopeptide repeat protein [bacterium]|nr:tetratricopeptide repeat protein [bacterium]
MRFSWIIGLAAAIALETACASFDGATRDRATASQRTARELYLGDWVKAVEAAQAAVDAAPDEAEVASFIVGEALYLAGDHEAAFPHLLRTLRGRDPIAALAALHLIRDLYVSRGIAGDIAATRPACANDLCRAVIAAEAWEWAHVMQRPWDERRLRAELHAPHTFRLFRAAGASAFRDLSGTTPEEEAYLAGAPFPTTELRIVTFEEAGPSLNLRNYFSPIGNAVFFAAGELSLPEDGPVTILPYITVPFRLYVDGKLVMERDADRFSLGLVAASARLTLAKGKHSVLLKLAPYLSEDAIFSIAFHTDGAAIPETDGDDPSTPKDGDDLFALHLRLMARDLLYGDVGIPQWEEAYASSDGSRSPALLFQAARAYRRSGDEQRAASVLSFLSGSFPDLILIKSELIDIYRNLGDDDGARRVLASEEGRDRSELPWLLRRGDTYYDKKWYAADLANAEELVARYRHHPVAYYYLSDSWQGMGNIAKAAAVRQKAVRLLPNYQPTLSRLADLYRELGKIPELLTTLRHLLALDPHHLGFNRMLGEAYLADGRWERALQTFQRALERNPEAAELWALAGGAAMLAGERDTAVTAFRRAWELAPESREYAERLDSVGETTSDFFVRYALSDGAVDEKIAAYRRARDTYPQKYAIVYDEGLQHLHYSGSVRSRFRMTIALNNEEGVREFATVANYGRVVSARVVKPDGTVLPTWRADAKNLYFLETAPGDVIDFVIESLQGPRSWLGGTDFRWFFASEGVYNLHSRLVILAPKDLKLLFHLQGPASRSEPEDKDGAAYVFETRGTYQPSREEAMPPFMDEVPFLAYTTVPSWDDFSRWQAVFLREQTENSAEIERQVMALVQGKDADGRVQALRDWVARAIGYLSDDRGIDKVKPEKTTAVFTQRSGDCKDKALLLKLMLAYAGIESRYALVKSRAGGALMRGLPSMQFDHAVVYIPPQEGVAAGYFVDPTASYDHYRALNPEIEGTDAFVVDEKTGRYEFVPLLSGLTASVALDIGADGAAKLTLTGAAASNGRFRHAADGDPFSYFSSLITRLAGAPVTVSQCTLASDAYAEPLEVACAAQPFVPALAAALFGKLVEPSERRYAALLGDRVGRWKVTVRGVAGPDTVWSVQNELFEWRAAPIEGGGVELTIDLRRTRIEPAEYAAFRAAVAAVMEKERALKGVQP